MKVSLLGSGIVPGRETASDSKRGGERYLGVWRGSGRGGRGAQRVCGAAVSSDMVMVKNRRRDDSVEYGTKEELTGVVQGGSGNAKTQG